MLKTNSKKAVENIRNYIVEIYNDEDQDTKQNAPFEEIAKTVYKTFIAEKWQYQGERNYYKTEQAGFEAWLQGLPSVLNTCYYYNREAKTDLQAILEQTDEQASKYTESQSELTLSYLIYREIKKAVEKGAR